MKEYSTLYISELEHYHRRLFNAILRTLDAIEQYRSLVMSITSVLLIKQKLGARGVMVIVIGNGYGDTSSNPGRDWLHFK